MKEGKWQFYQTLFVFPISDFFLLSVECLQQQEKIAFAMQWPIIKAKNGKILR
jgi:hypothetical protein